MTNQHKLITQIAQSKKVQKATQRTAQRVAAEAKRLDPDADLELADNILSVNGLPRVITTVTNVSPSAARHEWGGARQKAWRPMGRAADKFRG